MSNHSDIAIIGISCEFPKSKNLDQYWKNLSNGIECLNEFTENELLDSGISSEQINKKNYIRVGGVLEDIDKFDARFFGYNPREAELMDPQQRRLLEHAWLALADAGYDSLNTDQVIGICAGASLNTYLLNNLMTYPGIAESEYAQQLLFGNCNDYLATRIAYHLNLKGSAITLQTACSTSLVLIHQACQSLLTYQTDIMLAGGVSIRVPQKQGYLYAVDGILSKDGHCRPFSDDASGTIFTSGIGVLVLKRLQDAIENKDDIYAVIKTVAVNNDGADKMHYTAPSVQGQTEVIALAQTLSNIDIESIGYVEAHGTATNIGDPIEIEALTKAFKMKSQKKQFCALGSVKSNLGHLDIAAGIASIIKVALALKNKIIPPTLNLKNLNKNLNLKETPFYINNELLNWPTKENMPLYAGVSSFGIGGTNAHAILQDFPTQIEIEENAKNFLIILSAKSPDALSNMCYQLADYLKSSPESLSKITYTLQIGRAAFSFRRIIISNSREKVIAELMKQFEPIYCDRKLNQIEIHGNLFQKNLQELNKIATQWLSGHTINWQSGYKDVAIGRCHLPLNPFIREKYWMPPFNHKSNASKKINKLNEWFYLPSWKETIPPLFFTENSLENILVLVNKEDYSDTFIEILQKLSKKVIIIYSGERYQQINEGVFTVNIKEYSDLHKVMQILKNKNIFFNKIFHFLTLTNDGSEQVNFEEFNKFQDMGIYSLLKLIQSVDKNFSNAKVNIKIISNYLYNLSGSEAINPNKATLIALPKVIPKEYANISMQIIDIGPIKSLKKFTNVIEQKLLADLSQDISTEEEIVYRGFSRWIRNYTQAVIPEAGINRPKYLEAESVILITGGLGQMGLDIADYFSRFKDLKLVLLSRSVFIDKAKWNSWLQINSEGDPVSIKIKRIQKLEEKGLQIKIVQADVSKANELEDVVCCIEKSWGRIDSVIHAAGDTGNGIVAVLNPDNIQEYFKTFQSKVWGSYNLAKIFSERPLKTLILCSSMNAIIGGLGQIENTVVNVFIDQFSEYLSSHCDYRVLSINWGAVNINRPPEITVLPQFFDLSREHKTNYMNDDETHAVYDRIMHYDFGSRILISTVEINDVLHNWNRVASVTELAKDNTANSQNQELEVKREVEVAEFVMHCWKFILGVDQVNPNDNFFELGGHSLAAVQIVNKIIDHFNLKIHVMLLYELPVLKDFASKVESLILETKSKKLAEIF